MKAIKVISYYGHLYNAKTGERIHINEGREFTVLLDDEELLHTIKPVKPKVATAEEQLMSLKEDKKLTHLRKIYSRGEPLSEADLVER